MLNMMRNKSKWGALRGVLAAALLAAGSGTTLADPVTVDLCATTGSIAMPVASNGTLSVSILGYVAGDCSVTASATAPGGPVITVNQGDVVTVNLKNNLPVSSGILFQGQGMVPDTTGAAAAGTKIYTFTASSPGTFLYEAGLIPGAQNQAARGLYGALVVRPTPILVPRTDTATTVTGGSAVVLDAAVMSSDVGSTVSGVGVPAGATITAVAAGVSFTMSAVATAAGDGTVVVTGVTAYGNAVTAFNNEAVLVLSEIDPALNNSLNPAAFDIRNYAPRYFLINGKPYPNTDPISSTAGNKVLLRYVNAGVLHHSMGVLGLRQVFVAKDASLLPQLNHNVVAESLAPGQTGDAIATIPAAATNESKFAVYDASLSLHNSNAPGIGGMLTFVSVGTAGPAGPVVSNLALAGNNLTATITAGAGLNVSAAEYWIDSGSATSFAVTAAPIVSVSAAITLPTAVGNHVIYVRGQDDTSPTGIWGAVKSIPYVVAPLDTTGPTTSTLSLTPNPSNGTVSVALSASANDSTTGNSNIVAAEYTIDGGAAVAMSVNVAAPIASISATIPSGLTAGAHPITVRSQDAAGNWGATTSITLNVVAAGPVTSVVSASPNPANGVQGASTSVAAVRVTASMTSLPASTAAIVAAEAFIDCSVSNPCVNGTGFPFVPSDGAFNYATELGYGDIPLSTIALLTTGNHTISVHGKNAAGNWGAFATTILVVNQSAPTVTSIVVTPALTNGAVPVAISASATDVATGNQNIAGGEYFIDTVGAAGTGVAMTAAGTASPTRTLTATILATSVNLLSEGNHTVYVRARDALGNWSATFGAALSIDKTRPTIVSITRDGASPTNAASVSFTVTFSEAVVNVSNADFARTGALSSGNTNTGITVTGSGATRTVTVNTGTASADGTLGLNIPLTATIADLAGNTLNAGLPFVGPIYTIAKPPVVNSINRTTGQGANTNQATRSFTVTFSETVTGVTTSNFTLTTTGVTGASITSITGTGTTRTVNINTGSGSGTIRLDKTSNTGIVDAAGNAMVSGNFTTGQTFTVDKVVPTVVSINRVSATPTNAATVQFLVTFSEAVTAVSAADFSLTETLAGPTTITVNGNNGTTAITRTVTVTTGNATENGTLGLNMPATATVNDPAGNGVSNLPFTGQVYTVVKP